MRAFLVVSTLTNRAWSTSDKSYITYFNVEFFSPFLCPRYINMSSKFSPMLQCPTGSGFQPHSLRGVHCHPLCLPGEGASSPEKYSGLLLHLLHRILDYIPTANSSKPLLHCSVEICPGRWIWVLQSFSVNWYTHKVSYLNRGVEQLGESVCGRGFHQVADLHIL